MKLQLISLYLPTCDFYHVVILKVTELNGCLFLSLFLESLHYLLDGQLTKPINMVRDYKRIR